MVLDMRDHYFEMRDVPTCFVMGPSHQVFLIISVTSCVLAVDFDIFFNYCLMLLDGIQSLHFTMEF